MKFTPTASIFTSTCPGPGAGCGRSTYWRASGPPGAFTRIAFMTPRNYVEKRRGVNTLREGVEGPRWAYRSGGGLLYNRTIIFGTKAVLLARETTVPRRPNPDRWETWRSDNNSWADPRAYSKKRLNSGIVPRPHASARLAGTDTAARPSWSPIPNRSERGKVRTRRNTSLATCEAIPCTFSRPACARNTMLQDTARQSRSRYRFHAVPPRFPSTQSLYVSPPRSFL